MSPAPIELEDARRAVLDGVVPLPIEDVPLGEALGRRLGRDVVAGEPIQGFDNSAMDGYAVRAADTEGASSAAPAALRLVGESRAGHPASVGLGPAEAIAISTGAMLPEGADAVVKVEDTRREGAGDTRRGDPGDSAREGVGEVRPGEPDSTGRSAREDGRVLIEAPTAPDLNIRRAGEDIAPGDTVLRAGALLGPAALGALASLGVDPVGCHRRPRVAIVTSGDELTPAGAPLAPGGIRDSNSHSLPALVRLAGAELHSVSHTPDDPAATEAALAPALEADVAIVCGGVSVGEHDHVKAALERLGAEQVFWRVALKPGGPTWFGRRGRTLVFGLPGNPVSAMVTFLLLARPALLALGGGASTERSTTATLAADHAKEPGRAHAIRCRLELTESGWLAHPAANQGSHVLTSLLEADALALIPSQAGDVAAGTRVEVTLLDRSSMGR